VLEEGVLEGRKVFANILKYIGMGASSSFGNMFSVLGASVFVPYLPMTPIQILTNNLLYDVSQTAIPTDEVDPEQIAKPRPWEISSIARFILFIGPCSSIFDYTTFLIMLYVFKAWPVGKAPLFQTGWFVESLLTQTLIIHVIRTRKVPFFAEPRVGAANCHDRGDHVDRRAHPVHARWKLPRFHDTSAAVLAPSGADASGLCAADAGCQDMADSARVGVMTERGKFSRVGGGTG
jgi:hypothetical protein